MNQHRGVWGLGVSRNTRSHGDPKRSSADGTIGIRVSFRIVSMPLGHSRNLCGSDGKVLASLAVVVLRHPSSVTSLDCIDKKKQVSHLS